MQHRFPQQYLSSTSSSNSNQAIDRPSPDWNINNKLNNSIPRLKENVVTRDLYITNTVTVHTTGSHYLREKSKMYTYVLMILLSQLRVIDSLTCAEVLELPAGQTLSLNELKTIQPQEMVQCVSHLGKDQLSKSEADFIWRSIISLYNGIANIPDVVLMQLHWVTTAVTPADYANITLSDIDVIQNFGLNYNLNPEQLSAIANRVRQDFADKLPEHYTYYDLTAFKQILCAFNRSEIERIHPSVYREAALLIGKLENCDPEVMSGFANLAVQRQAFGLPSTWTKLTVKIIGKVTDYVPKEIMKSLRTDIY